MENPVVAGIGEILWDIFPSGRQLGGAPFNFTYHAVQAGCIGYVISAVGDDEFGDEISNIISNLGISSYYLQRSDYPTGTVTVATNKEGHPEFSIHENVAWDHIRWDKDLELLAGELDAICFGSLAQRSPSSQFSILSFIKATKPECLKVFDINLRQEYYSKEVILNSLSMTNILKLNETELPVLSGYLGFFGLVEEQLRQILRYFNLKFIVYTMGGKGSIIISNEEISFVSALPVRVVDSVGAGDAFTAVVTTGILKERPLKETHEKAARVAAYLCTQKGATPKLPEELMK